MNQSCLDSWVTLQLGLQLTTTKDLTLPIPKGQITLALITLLLMVVHRQNHNVPKIDDQELAYDS